MKTKTKHSNLYYDIMYPLWNLYHKWWLHKGKYGMREWLSNCRHLNPYNVLTPRRLKKQFEDSKDIEI